MSSPQAANLQNMNMQMMDILGEDNVKVSQSKKLQMMDEQVSLINKRDKSDSENRFRKKGQRNKNNPSNTLKLATEVLIVKQANYMDCISCHVCIQDNVYKIYDTNFEPIYSDTDLLRARERPLRENVY